MLSKSSKSVDPLESPTATYLKLFDFQQNKSSTSNSKQSKFNQSSCGINKATNLQNQVNHHCSRRQYAQTTPYRISCIQLCSSKHHAPKPGTIGQKPHQHRKSNKHNPSIQLHALQLLSLFKVRCQMENVNRIQQFALKGLSCERLKKSGAVLQEIGIFCEKGRCYCLPIVIAYLHEKNQKIRWSRFLENL